MPYSTLVEHSFVRENPFEYPHSPRSLVYEVSLRTASYSHWLSDLQGAHRLVQTLLQGHLKGEYQLLDFVLWPKGLFTRVLLKDVPTLSGFLGSLKERSSFPGESPKAFWEDEPQWIRLVPPDKLEESTRLFLERADQIRQEVERPRGSSPNLFFFYRDPRLVP